MTKRYFLHIFDEADRLLGCKANGLSDGINGGKHESKGNSNEGKQNGRYVRK